MEIKISRSNIAAIFLLGLLLGIASATLITYFVWVPIDLAHNTSSPATAVNNGVSGLKEELKRQQDELQKLSSDNADLRNQLSKANLESFSRQMSNTVAQAFIEAVATGAEDATRKSGFWTEYHLDNKAVAAACWKTAAFLRMSEARIAAGAESASWGRGACVMTVIANSNAENTGIKRFDIIVRYGDFKIDNSESFDKAKALYAPPGTPVEMVIVRGTSHMKVSVARGFLGVTLD